ncbi:AGE family epimerase/isomerase [Ruficoccus amylovorans]|uniref:AGE family epimerase/isomerase n=1 Tax=Ruficoccus amylovorans TaxID=1804625 RepID=A0A842HI92_9BACT|nr:AGE family epimerase/isomerase [Ruficoccus amylovorans]MBC2595718.1 AGE family epimerase/isomerase [Ruficoccus amylovorans]
MATKLPSAFSKTRLIELKSIYRDGLLHDSLPFWFPRAVDPEFGGYFTCFDRDGSRLQDDKSVWFQGRMAWTLATAWLEVEQRPEWLEWARSGIDFIERYCFDTDQRMFFSVTRDGLPLRKRRYQFSECFAIIAFSAYSRASGQSRYQDRARKLLADVIHRHRTPGLLPPKVDPETRPMKGLAMPMILLSTAQQLRKHSPDPAYTQIIDECIEEIRTDFLKPEFQCVLETVADDGGFIDTLDGRCVNPGHSIEAGWFILEEARQRGGDSELIKLGCRLIDWSLEIGWDNEHGGLFYFRDAKGLPCTEYWHDMKFWWPHNEAIIATLLAAELTGEARYANWHSRIHEWAYDHFPDKQHGEWFGYLHRDGSLSTPVKGTPYKGAFHVPRMMLLGWQSVQRQLDRIG